MSYAEEMSGKAFVFIGNVNVGESEFDKYFELDYSTDGNFEDPEFDRCQFCKDVNIDFYDEDFMVKVYLDEPVDAEELIMEEVPSEIRLEQVVEDAKDMGLTDINALVFIADTDIKSVNPKKKYCGMTFIGAYDMID